MKLRIENISKKIGSFVLKNTSLEISEGEYFVILGKSGAGKSVLLELLTGLLLPDTGKIFLDDVDITRTKIQKRNIGLVFQNQSLFPHISVRDNISYSLKMFGHKKSFIIKRVDEISELLGIGHLMKRNPSTLSLGEGQRVALARNLVTEPSCLLLDEPLSSLDTLTKSEIRRLLRKINRGDFAKNTSTNMSNELRPQTIIHVTHDYEEAIALADRIAVFEDGQITQVGKPKEIFKNPKSGFIAKFVGIKNFYRGKLEKNSEKTAIFYTNSNKNNNQIEFHISNLDYEGAGCIILRSEDITISNVNYESSARNSLEGIIIDIETVRTGIEIVVDIGGMDMSSLITEASLKKLDLYCNKKVYVSFKSNAAKFIRS